MFVVRTSSVVWEAGVEPGSGWTFGRGVTGLATAETFTRGDVQDELVCLLSIMQYFPCLPLLFIVVE